MPIKEFKIDTQNEQIIERILHSRCYSLILNKKLCKGCEICKVICPRESIEIIKSQKVNGNRAKPPALDFDKHKCSYCGICEAICPFGALQTRVNNKRLISVVEKGSFPNLIHEIEVDSSKCDVGCLECENVCPLNLVKVTVITPQGQELHPEEAKLQSRIEGMKVKVDIKKELCPSCRLCEKKCPKKTIRMRKIMHGLLKVKLEKCPQGCQDCLDVCPIPGALYLRDNKVHADEAFCVFCGACKIVCPVEGALHLDRRAIQHTPVSSGAWNAALEKLTSTHEYSKEVRWKGNEKARIMAEKRLIQAKEDKA